MKLTPNQRIAALREKNIRQIDIAQELGYTRISLINNVIHGRNISGKKTEKIRIFIADKIGLPYDVVWGQRW